MGAHDDLGSDVRDENWRNAFRFMTPGLASQSNLDVIEDNRVKVSGYYAPLIHCRLLNVQRMIK